MVSTVTTATITSVTSVTSAITGTPQTLALFAILTLVALLIQKEVLSAASGEWQRSWSRGLNVALAPLALACAAIVVANVSAVLS